MTMIIITSDRNLLVGVAVVKMTIMIMIVMMMMVTMMIMTMIMIIDQNLLVGVAGLSFASADDFRLGFPLQCAHINGEYYDADDDD